MIAVSIQSHDFDPGAEQAVLEKLGGGAVASFTGIVRADGGLESLYLDHYPAMTQAQTMRIAQMALDRWSLLGVRVVHRVGNLVPGDRIVFVATAASHRVAALESCAFVIDWLKSRAPFWKRERFADGRETWVEARAQDDARADDWEQRKR